MPLPQGRGPYNLPSGDRATHSTTHNPQADAGVDDAAYDADFGDDIQPIGARGASDQPTGFDFAAEDRATARSDETGAIPQGEVNDLKANLFPGEGDVQGRTRGKKVDAFQQERDIDQIFDETGIADADQDVEIGRAIGR